MKQALVILSLIALCMTIQAQNDCKCYPYPWLKECRGYCELQIINAATQEELTFVMGIDEATASNVKKVASENDISNLRDFKQGITNKEFKSLKRALKNLSEKQIQYLSLPEQKRVIVNEGFKQIKEDVH